MVLSMFLVQWIACTIGLLSSVRIANGFSNDRNDNLAAYWGQDSAGHQQRLGFYCDDDSIDVFPLAFLYIFFGKGGQPVIDFANICSQGSGNFPGTNLADCSFMAADIQKCQAKGKIVTLSLGGASANVGFSSDAQAAGFAVTIWNMFLGGNGGIRPFGSAVLDGVDLDIENGSSAHYNTFVNTIRSLSKNANKRYYVTAAPQCPFPDEKIGQALNSAFFDAVYVQFYNNFCETSAPSEFNFATWDHWAKTQSLNKDVKVYIGAPGSADSAGNGFVSSQMLINVAKQAQNQYSSFGGIMLWDTDSAYTNSKYHVTVKKAIFNGSVGTPPSASTQKPTPTADPTVTPVPTRTTTPISVPTPSPVSSKTLPISSSKVKTVVTSETPIPDPRAKGRVRWPTLGLRAALPIAAGKPIPRRGSRFFKS